MSEQDLTGIGELQALLGQGAHFEGKLTFEGRIRIDGSLRGEVFSDGVLILGPSAEVTGTLEVGTLIVRGATLTGEVRAQRLVEIYAPSHVSANVVSPQLYLEKGSQFEGSCSLPEEPEPEASLGEQATEPG